MNLEALTAIAPVDGRYRNKAEELAEYFSEYGLMKYRVLIEIEYFISLCEIPLPQLKEANNTTFSALRKIYEDFSVADAQRIKEIEKTTNHDVKSVEYFIKEKINMLDVSKYREFIHFGLTSQDINNTAIPLSLKDFVSDVYYPLIDELLRKLKHLSNEWSDIPLLAHTHGQPASPTRLGKEIAVFIDRIESQLSLLRAIPYAAKFGGATGNMNAHVAAYPNIDWTKFANHFVNKILGLQRSQITTQIEHYDHLAAQFDTIARINTILIDLCRDFWTYISMEYFKQRVIKDEVGSSAMPHKVNPIDFENAEGNFGMANALFNHMASKLPISRLQRDLTDSTVLRNIGVPFAHSLIAYKSLIKGLSKITLNQSAIDRDLNANWAVISEGIQTILRRESYPNPYEALKELTRTGGAISGEDIKRFIEGLNLSESIKNELFALSPSSYTGIKPKLY